MQYDLVIISHANTITLYKNMGWKKQQNLSNKKMHLTVTLIIK